MSQSGKQRHRDVQPGFRELRASERSGKYRVFRITQQERQQIAACLRQIDAARDTIEAQHNPANRLVLRDLRAAADGIYELVNALEETGD